ncbi:hypothetical protein LTR36_010241 [Oleoguttula mirabilis]|uniref:Uncharacterized protein n=1 Tax=Oleoguttula mirabilis TaxID=1507867 RepID=A0AAV9JSZ2_9PEZI|nr:hypothetical protein LTR36_010241 [Oleoguttula mirabilis]
MEHARTTIQHQYAHDLVLELRALLLVPYDQPAPRMHQAFGLLRSALQGPKILGPMKKQYLDRLFIIAEQALRAIAKTVSHCCGGRQALLSTLQWPPAADSPLQPKANTGVQQDGEVEEHIESVADEEVGAGDSDWEDEDDQEALSRLIRIFLLRHTVTTMFSMPIPFQGRVKVARKVLKLCSGAATKVDIGGLGIHAAGLPAVDQEWLAIAFEGGAFAILGLARCVSARFMGRPVSIWNEAVVGTDNDIAKSIESWVVLDENAMKRYVRQHGGNSREVSAVDV